ncbi:putative cobalt transporter subunit (CbtB) [Actinomadura glauciflava]|nr:putative cobalt transporter subunit (CbtB) [Actinomadura glauciflava]
MPVRTRHCIRDDDPGSQVARVIATSLSGTRQIPYGGSVSTLSARHIPLSHLVPWLLAVPALLLLGYLVLMDNGAVSQTGGYLHELMHDGRHLLGVPCH